LVYKNKLEHAERVLVKSQKTTSGNVERFTGKMYALQTKRNKQTNARRKVHLHKEFSIPKNK